MTLLVLEDEALTRCLVTDELRAQGYLVAEASSVEDARAVLAAMRIDLAFLDLHIPGPASGLDLAHAVRDLQPHAKVILTSGKVWPESLGELQALGPFLRKPYLISHVIDLVGRCLSAPG